MAKKTKNKIQASASRDHRKWIASAVAVLLLIGVVGIWRTFAKPSTYLLMSDGDAEWIRFDAARNVAWAIIHTGSTTNSRLLVASG